jgi:hypothetical protein
MLGSAVLHQAVLVQVLVVTVGAWESEAVRHRAGETEEKWNEDMSLDMFRSLLYSLYNHDPSGFVLCPWNPITAFMQKSKPPVNKYVRILRAITKLRTYKDGLINTYWEAENITLWPYMDNCTAYQSCCTTTLHFSPNNVRLGLGSGPDPLLNILLVLGACCRVASHLGQAHLKVEKTQGINANGSALYLKTDRLIHIYNRSFTHLY